MRFLAAPWMGILKSGAWLRYAEHTNRCAAVLEKELRSIPGIKIMFPRQANSVFVKMPPAVADALTQRGWVFYTFIGVGGTRFMCSWDTTEEDIAALAADIRDAFNAQSSKASR
jgi:threonine aldolase